MKTRKWGGLFGVALLLAAGLAMSARAQDADPPGRVARLNFLQGTVSFQPAGGSDNDWIAAEPNRPMTMGDRIWTDTDGRAELHIGSTAIRLDRSTGISFLNLADNGVQLQVSAGTVIVRLRRLDADDSFEVDAPNLSFSLLRAGDYSVTVDPNNDVTVVAASQGQGLVTGGGRTFKVLPDQRATFTGADNLTYDLADTHAAPASEFERWAADRDKREDHLESAQYVSPEATGTEDLDTYGGWREYPEYGMVWFPRGVAAGWAPYRFGHWVWLVPWGWTWVADEPWGFAPFHYGRWAVFGGAWGWVPGPLAVRPVYAPALVAWVGGGPGFRFSASFGVGGGVAWFPLGPREVFVPSYRVSDAYVTRVNVTNTVVERTTVINAYHNTNATNVTYVNQHANGGVTAVSHDTFVNARSVGRNVVTGQERELAAAPVARNVAAAPEHASLVGGERPAAVRPPAAILNRTAVTVRTPPAQTGRFDRQANGSAPPQASQGQAQGQARTAAPAQPGQPGQPLQGQRQAPEQGRAIQPTQSPASQPQQPPQPQSGYRPPAGGTAQGNAGQPRQNETVRGNAGAPPPAVQSPAAQPAAPQGNAGQPRQIENVRGNAGAPPPAVQPPAAARTAPQPAAQPAAAAQPQPRAVPAPPVHQPTPSEQQYDNQKQQEWQQQHQQVHPQERQQPKPSEKDSRRPKK